jgi:drug/metabolite transporter (DMT)-like permease
MTLLMRGVPLVFLIMWSSGSIFVKLGLQEASVWSFLAVRAIGTLLVLSFICALVFKRKIFSNLFNLPALLIIKMLFIGLLLQVAYQSFFFLAIDNKLSPGVLSIVLGLQPILTPIIAREDVGVKGFLILLLGFLGLGVAVLGAREISGLTYTGIACGVASVFAMSVGTVFQKKIIAHPLASAFYQNLAASIIFFIVVLCTDWNAMINAKFILASAWMILIVSTGAVLLLFYMLSKNAASNVSVLFYMVPILTIALDYLVFGNKVTPLTMAGAIIVIIAILFYRSLSEKRAFPKVASS